MMIPIRLTLLSTLLSFSGAASAQSDATLAVNGNSVFTVSKASEPIVVDGRMNESSWRTTEARTFDSFYRVETPDDQQRTTFRMLWDDTHLYLFYEMQDKYLTARETERDGAPYFDDCAEIFFIPVPEGLDTHIGYELNIYKASNDFVFFNDFYNGRSGILKTFNPEFAVEVTYKGTLNDHSDEDQGWTMELAIPIANFDGLANFVPVKPGNRWAFLAVRQDRNDAEGNRRSTSTIFPIGDISQGGVHQPDRFGLLEFVE